jgi:iron uptake system EfeUOB component EfeO/EfeM
MNQRLRFIIAVIFLAIVQMGDEYFVIASQGKPSIVAQVSAIEKEVSTIKQFRSQKTSVKRFAANLIGQGEKESKWRIFKNEAELEKENIGDNIGESANVWLKNGQVVTASFTIQTESGDWIHFITYYYRKDGTLAKIEAQLNTFYGNQTVLRNRYYSQRGELLKQSDEYRNLRTKQKNKPNENFIDEPIPNYLNVSQLPFYALVTKGGPN